MNRSSKMVPFFIIVALIFFVCAVVLLCDFTPETLRSYDVFGINKAKAAYIDKIDLHEDDLNPNQNLEESFVQRDETSGDYYNDVDDSTLEQNYASYEVVENIVQGKDSVITHDEAEYENTEAYEGVEEYESTEEYEDTVDTPIEFSFAQTEKSTNELIEIESVYTRTMGQESDKVDFYTDDTECDYRVFIKTKINDNPLYGNIKISLYDERGIMLEEGKPFWPSYGNTSSYCDEFFCDFNLEKTKLYTLKITTSEDGGDYQIYIAKYDRDAGADKDNAKQINVGEEITAVLNTSLSDWYVCEIAEAGTYEVVIHNIDIGDYVKVEAIYDEERLFGVDVENENNSSRSFKVYREGKVYLCVTPKTDTPMGTYIMIIKKCD